MNRRALRKAIDSRSASFERSISCISPIRPRVIYPLRFEPGASITFTFGHTDPIPLRGRFGISFTAVESIRVERRAATSNHVEASISRYSYRISVGDGGSKEAFAFHWDEPADGGGVSHPHLHLGDWFQSHPERTVVQDVHKLHIPTGAVSLAMVIRFLIEELDVEPIRSTWDDILANVLD